MSLVYCDLTVSLVSCNMLLMWEIMFGWVLLCFLCQIYDGTKVRMIHNKFFSILITN
jgi:hypothetical protein